MTNKELAEAKEAFNHWLATVYDSDAAWDAGRNCYVAPSVHMAWQAWRDCYLLRAAPAEPPAVGRIPSLEEMREILGPQSAAPAEPVAWRYKAAKDLPWVLTDIEPAKHRYVESLCISPQAPSGWVSVKERLPERGAVLVWCPARKNTYSAIRVGDVWRHFGNSPHEMTEEPSHWMSLPTPPRSEEG